MKALISEDDRILGFTAFGSEVGELLPVVQLAMKANLPLHGDPVADRHSPDHLGGTRQPSLHHATA